MHFMKILTAGKEGAEEGGGCPFNLVSEGNGYLLSADTSKLNNNSVK